MSSKSIPSVIARDAPDLKNLLKASSAEQDGELDPGEETDRCCCGATAALEPLAADMSRLSHASRDAGLRGRMGRAPFSPGVIALMKLYILVFSILLSFVALALEAQEDSAWDLLIRDSPSRLRDVSSTERGALKLMPSNVLATGRVWDSIDDMVLSNGQTLGEYLNKAGDAFDMTSFSIDNGAFRLSDGDFALSGIAGQADAGVVVGGSFVLKGGFLTQSSSVDILFADGFESGDTSRWSDDSLGAHPHVFF